MIATDILDEFDVEDLPLVGTVARVMRSALDGRTNQVEHRRQRYDDLLAWGRAYLPHYFSDPSSKMHTWLAERADNSLQRRGARVNCIGPRDGAKSTIISTTHCLRAAVERSEPLIWIVCETQPQADTQLDHIKNELIDNAQLARDYPDACGKGPMWQTSQITLTNGVAIQAFGVGAKIRGRRKRADRPTFIVCDDLQSDVAMHSGDRREKNWRWFTGALLKAGSSRTNVFNLANAIHRDAIGMRLCRTPGWQSRVFSAITRWPNEMGLWAEWADIWNNVTDPESSDKAETFALENHERLHDGAELLWPDHEDLLALMQLRERDGHQAFEREKQSRPVNPEECEWPEEYFDDRVWFDEWPPKWDVRTMALDPSKGRDSKRGDYSAFCLLQQTADTLYFDFDLARRDVAQMVADGVALYRQFQPDGFAIEANAFQELLGDDFAAEFRAQGVSDPKPYAIENRVNKQVRIRRLGPWLSQRRIRFKRSPGTLLAVAQMKDFPDKDSHDDGPDAAEMALWLRGQLLMPEVSDGLGDSLI